MEIVLEKIIEILSFNIFNKFVVQPNQAIKTKMQYNGLCFSFFQKKKLFYVANDIKYCKLQKKKRFPINFLLQFLHICILGYLFFFLNFPYQNNN